MVPIHLIDDKEILMTIEKANSNNNDSEWFLESYKQVKELFEKLLRLKLDSTELEYLKLIVLLRNGEKLKI
jgi:hypothetical protein